MPAGPDALPVDAFLDELKQLREKALAEIREGRFGVPSFLAPETTEAAKRPEIVFLLQLGVYPEFRETYILARQIQRLDDVNLVCRVGQQIADEAKHAKVLVDQLKAWGADPFVHWEQPIYEWSASFDYMDKLTTPVEYFAGSNFIGEGLFLPSILQPMVKSDPETFAVYQEHILPDEPSHVRIGRDVIAKYCTSFEIQERVRRVARNVVKQYCIGFAAAMKYAAAARAGTNPEKIRDAVN
jgi:hypothetical protein